MNNALTETQLMEMAPSIFTDQAHSSRSTRYAHVPTIEVIKQLRKQGYVPTEAKESALRSKHADRLNYQRHFVRLRQREYLEQSKKVGTVVPELLLINSHDGSSSFRMSAGLFRFICSNGMVVQSADYGSIILQHLGDELMGAVREASEQIAGQMPKIIRATEAWDKIKMSHSQRVSFAKRALDLRYGQQHIPVTPSDILTPRRNEDEAPTLWRTFNVIQEHLTQGGPEGKSEKGRSVKVRSIKSVNNILHFNRGLWEMAEKIAA